jgi:hypothetical protein
MNSYGTGDSADITAVEVAAIKDAVFSQFPRCPSDESEMWKANNCDALERHEFPIMGYSVRDADWRLTLWQRWNGHALEARWDMPVAGELYNMRHQAGAATPMNVTATYDFIGAYTNLIDDPAHTATVSCLSALIHEQFRGSWGTDAPVATPTLPPSTVTSLEPTNGAGFRPHILLVVCDDYGWMDVGFHGSEIATPFIDQLAREGTRLESHYTLHVCTPTRAAMLTGIFPMKLGLQTSTISPAKPYGVPTSVPTVADALSSFGYATHGIGKWHLGFCRKAYLPTARGFNTFYGFWNGADLVLLMLIVQIAPLILSVFALISMSLLSSGAEHYFTHVRDNNRCPANFSNGLDYHSDLDDVKDKNGTYSPQDLAERAAMVIDQHARATENASLPPLFLYLAFESVHDPYEVPKMYTDRFPSIADPDRRTYAGMVSAMDDAIGNVTRAFVDAGTRLNKK